MGFSNQTTASKTFASMKVIKSDDNTSKPFFIIKDKVDGKWVEKQRFVSLSAEPYDIELGSYEFNGSPVDTVTMQMIDGEDKIQLEFNLDSGLSRNLLNTLLGEPKIGRLSMSLYTNKAGYPSIGIENDGQKTQWKYKFEELPEVIKNKKGVVIDNEEYLAFMRTMVSQIKEKLLAKPVRVAEKPTEPLVATDKKSKHEDAEAAGYSPNKDIDNLPF